MHTVKEKRLWEEGFKAGFAAAGPRSSPLLVEMKHAWTIHCGYKPKVGMAELISKEEAINRALQQFLNIQVQNNLRRS